MTPPALGYNFIEQEDDTFLVLTPKHDRYLVDLKKQTCTCPWSQFHEGEKCKHRAMIERALEPKIEKPKREQNDQLIITTGGVRCQ